MNQTNNKLSPVECADLFAFVGVRKIIGDPYGKLMQDEVADRIQKLVNVLRETVGLMDSLKIAATAPAMTKAEAMMLRVCYRSMEDTLNEAMPEWDAVCKSIHEANEKSPDAGATEKDHDYPILP